MKRRALLASGLGIAGAVIAVKASRNQAIDSNLVRSRLLPASRDPLRIAMLDEHAARISPLVPDIESAISRRLVVERLPADQLYANFTIDLLQQTGRYDAVSMNDAWIPYFGRRGYLAGVPEMEGPEIGRRYPTKIRESARGVDGTELVAYPWTFDFTCSAVSRALGISEWSENWTHFFPAVASKSDPRVGLALATPASAVETYRAVLLSYGDDLVDPHTHQPRLDGYAARRALETTLRLAKLSGPEGALNRTLAQVPAEAANGEIGVVPVLWAMDTGGLWSTDAWEMRLLPVGRTGHAATTATFWMWGVPAGAPDVKGARMFVRLMTSLPIQSRLWQTTGLLPAIRPAINGEWDPGGNDLRSLTLQALDRCRFRPQLRSFRTLMEIAGQMVADTVAANAGEHERRLLANEQMRSVLIQEGELKG